MEKSIRMNVIVDFNRELMGFLEDDFNQLVPQYFLSFSAHQFVHLLNYLLGSKDEMKTQVSEILTFVFGVDKMEC